MTPGSASTACRCSNKNVQAVRDLVYAQGNNSVAPYWLNQGADGWRLDVMGDGSFPADFWQQFRTAVKTAKPNAPIIGELWKKDEVLPKIHGDQADTTMNYRFRNAILGFFGKVDNKGFPDDGQSDQPPSLFASKLNSIREDYPDATYYTLMNLMDSHDTERILWSLTPGQYNREDREFNAANLAHGQAAPAARQRSSSSPSPARRPSTTATRSASPARTTPTTAAPSPGTAISAGRRRRHPRPLPAAGADAAGATRSSRRHAEVPADRRHQPHDGLRHADAV